jgi:hypothetical protein
VHTDDGVVAVGGGGASVPLMKVLHQGGKKGRGVHEGAVRWRRMIKLK